MSDLLVMQEDIEAYKENGFIQFKSFFSKQETATLRAAIDDAITTDTICLTHTSIGIRQ